MENPINWVQDQVQFIGLSNRSMEINFHAATKLSHIQNLPN